MSWKVEENAFDPDRIAMNGNKFMIGNGAIGYRGTLEEYTKEQLTASTVAGLYDKVGEGWREPINAPNGLFTRIVCDGEPLSALHSEVARHSHSLDLSQASFGRDTVFAVRSGGTVEIRSERFVSMEQLNLIAMKYEFLASAACDIVVETGIDGDVWDINGPHLENKTVWAEDGIVGLTAITHELRMELTVAEAVRWNVGARRIEENRDPGSSIRRFRLRCEPGVSYGFTKYVCISYGESEGKSSATTALSIVNAALPLSYETHLQEHRAHWERKWEASDIVIDGDEEAQFALRYSLYQLHIIAPTHSERVSIPARGLSGQVYKGAVFWDTEMFMLPFFLHTQPEIARNLVMYRVHTLDGARRKAAEYGYLGAFYAWESQDTGDDACTLFNLTDVFTNRPMRTYFRDKQIHISADAAFGIWQYYEFTGDESVLLEGGAEVILECARFFYSYAYYKHDKQRYEILDVTGPDEYHERVNNNAFTNALAHKTIEIALQTLEWLAARHPQYGASLIAKLNYREDARMLKQMLERLYVPRPDPETSIIEQFDGYRKLEDVDLWTLKSRILNESEYLGGGNGLATTTRILKQADVVLLLHLFKRRYSQNVKRANWEYYEPRTEHGSSLSACIYALVASDIGNPDWAYRYFLRTATIDLTGESKQYVGTLYIGGTHPAANGGAWMAAVLGFAGVDAGEGAVRIRPALPEGWRSIKFGIAFQGGRYRIEVSRSEVHVSADAGNESAQPFIANGKSASVAPGAIYSWTINKAERGARHA
ncbi:glycoside hydrolase family 65 protein [Cohnella panacarvi]|uniref:glycoside hydrolase family 65 protein n=1 Tax=Cohnella panacarvi TaxID=400776 RepID=UPI00047942FC|nr:glycosyl hydrolase family 65 protein [Cohnella panacarvi]